MEPTNQRAYLERFAANTYVFGFGLDTGQSMPCPFCAARDWCQFKIVDVVQVMSQEHICRECKRGAKAIYTRTPDSTGFRMVQTSGPEQPTWLDPQMEKV
jgi:hypothetical protein